MKQLHFIFSALLLFSASAIADDFSPTLLTLDVENELLYQFDGNNLDIPVTVGGTPAAVWLVINTHDKGDEIGSVRNGYLGWHYVNNIDTTVYISPRYSFLPGDHVIEWDGTSSEGGSVESGSYDYYLWGYDDQSDRQMASDFVMMSHDWQPSLMQLYCFDKDNLPLPNPVFFGNIPWYDQRVKGGSRVYRWQLGNDPYDITYFYRGTTICPIYTTWDSADEPGFLSVGFSALDKDDFDVFYQPCRDNDKALFTLLKWTFIAEGDAILHDDWGGWDSDLVFESPVMADNPDYEHIEWTRDSGLYTDFNYLYCTGQEGAQHNWNYIYCISFEGNLVFAQNHEEFNIPDDPNPDGEVNSNPYLMDWMYNKENHWVLWGNSCLQECVDYTGLLNGEGNTHTIVWQNGNGDFFFDSGYKPNADPAWFCIGGSPRESEIQGRHSNLDVDSMGFNIWGTGQFGLTNFGVSTQDGTGIGYMHFADETVGDQEIRKGGGTICDNGGAFDGMYWPKPSIRHSSMWIWGEAMFIGMDNAHGVIKYGEPSLVGQNEKAPQEFMLYQNSPNPFNPVTTISFTLPEPEDVSIEIYNMAGQKIETLLNGFLNAGNYSVTWDGSAYSAGAYIYTVRYGSISKMKKMLLVK